jgi:hypothetical protein
MVWNWDCGTQRPTCRTLHKRGVPIWFIGTDMLYAYYPTVPTTFTVADLPYTVMGVESYDLQSYGDDGGEGCPLIDAGPG